MTKTECLVLTATVDFVGYWLFQKFQTTFSKHFLNVLTMNSWFFRGTTSLYLFSFLAFMNFVKRWFGFWFKVQVIMHGYALWFTFSLAAIFAFCDFHLERINEVLISHLANLTTTLLLLDAVVYNTQSTSTHQVLCF